MLRSLFTLLACLLTTSLSAQSSMSTGTGSLRLQSAGGSHAYARVQFPDGRAAERFILLPGDCVRAINDCRDNRERVEFSGARSPIQQNQEVWLSWSVFVPADFPTIRSGAEHYTFGQVHQLGNSGPELMFSLFDDGFHVVMKDPFRLDDDPMNPIPDFRFIRVASQSGIKGRWTDILVQANFTRAESGFLNVWVNGRNVLNYRGPTSNANDPQFFKYGLYRNNVSRCGGPCPQAVAYYADVKQGRSRAAVE